MVNSIVFNVNYKYVNQLETAAKSLMYHNHNLKIYIINYDIPQEWFWKMNYWYSKINILFVDLKIESAILSDLKKPWAHIDTIAYARLLIPQLIPDEQVLYLDSDVIVNDDLSSLLNLDMGDKAIGAVTDFNTEAVSFKDAEFNSGVLLINNKLLKENYGEKIKDWINIGKEPGINNGYQSVLNNLFQDNYYRLPDTYNVGIGSQNTIFWEHNEDKFRLFNQRLIAARPYKIIHYESSDKPWNLVSSGELRVVWWQYYTLSPEDICNHVDLPEIRPKSIGDVLIFTSDQNIDHLQELVTQLPQVTFHIAAWSFFGQKLLKMLKYPNVRLHPTINGTALDRVKASLNAYLDINYGAKDQGIIKEVEELNIPILSFKQVSNNENLFTKYEIFEDDDVQGMINRIKNFVERE